MKQNEPEAIRIMLEQPETPSVRKRHSAAAAEKIAVALDELVLSSGSRPDPRAYREALEAILEIISDAQLKAASRDLHRQLWDRLPDSPFAIALRRFFLGTSQSLRDEAEHCRWSHVAISRAGERLKKQLTDGDGGL